MSKYIKNIKDTIIALSTPLGKSGIGVIKISGDLTKKACKIFFNRKATHKLVSLSTFINPKNNEKLDKGILIFFEKPNSFTGEDVLEFHAHGSPIMLNYIINIIIFELEIRLAFSGEFICRSFLNGKLNLEESENILNLIESESIITAKLALNNSNNFFSKEIIKISNKLNDLYILIEACINFSDDEINEDLYNKIEILKNKIIDYFKKIINNFNLNKTINDGIKILIIGNSNVGKSTLFNLLINENKSIISNFPGTTRNLIDKSIWIDGMRFNIVDTAGIRKTKNKIEILGINKTINEIYDSDYILYVTDKKIDFNKIENLIENLLKNFNKNISFSKKIEFLIIKNKSDLHEEQIKKINFKKNTIIYISAKNNEGINLIIDHFKLKLKDKIENINYIVNMRQYECIKKSLLKLNNLSIGDLVIFSYEIKSVIKIVNNIYCNNNNINDNLLDNIFSKFCIGK